MFEDFFKAILLLRNRDYFRDFLKSVAEFYAIKISVSLLVDYFFNGYDVFANHPGMAPALAGTIIALHGDGGSKTVERELRPDLKALSPQVHSAPRISILMQTYILNLMLAKEFEIQPFIYFLAFVGINATSLALIGFHGPAERWLAEKQRRPLFIAQWREIALPSAFLAIMYYGDYLIDPSDRYTFDPFTTLTILLCPVVYTLTFHRMREAPT